MRLVSRVAFFYYAFMLFVLCACVAAQETVAAKDRSDANLSELMIQLRTNDAVTRGYAIQKIAALRSKAAPAVALLIETLSDNRPLMRLGGSLFRQSLGTSPSELAAEALVAIGNPAEKPLIETLTSNRNYDVRAGAAKVLGEMESRAAFDRLIAIAWDQQRLLRDHPPEIYTRTLWDFKYDKPAAWKVRQQSILALGRIGDANAVDSLLKLLEDEDQWIQAASVKSLDMIRLGLVMNGNKQEHEKLTTRINPVFQYVLRKAVSNKHYIVQEEVAKHIRNFTTPEDANLMLMIIRQEKPYVNEAWKDVHAGKTKEYELQIQTVYEWRDAQKAAVERMGDIKDPRTVEPLLELIRQKHDSLLAPSIIALGRIGTMKAAEGLVGLLLDPNYSDDIRQNAAESLSWVYQPLAVETLIAAHENGRIPVAKYPRIGDGKLRLAGQVFDSIQDAKSWYEQAKVRYEKGDDKWWEKAPTEKETAQYAEMTQAIENGWLRLGMSYGQITAKWGTPSIFMDEGHGKSFAVYHYHVGSIRSLIFDFENGKLVGLKDNTDRKISIEGDTESEKRNPSDNNLNQ